MKLLHHPSCGAKLSVWSASLHGHTAVLKWIIASGKDVDFHERHEDYEWYDEEGRTAIEISRKKGKIETVSLLEHFQSDPNQTRQAIRQELGVAGGRFSFFFFLF